MTHTRLIVAATTPRGSNILYLARDYSRAEAAASEARRRHCTNVRILTPHEYAREYPPLGQAQPEQLSFDFNTPASTPLTGTSTVSLADDGLPVDALNRLAATWASSEAPAEQEGPV